MGEKRSSAPHPNRNLYDRVQDLVLTERLTDTSSDAVYMTKGDLGRTAEVERLRKEAEQKLGAAAIEYEDPEI